MAVNIDSLIKQWQQSMTDANAANESRYQDILGLYGDTGGVSMMDLVSQLGQGDMRAVNTGEKQAKALAEQNLIGRGLGNTTARAAEMRNVQNAAEIARQGVGEQTLEKQLGVMGAQAQMMGNRTDQGPDAGLFAQLIQQASAQTNPNVDATTGRATGLGGRSVTSIPGNLDWAFDYDTMSWNNQASAGGGGGGGGGGSSGNGMVSGGGAGSGTQYQTYSGTSKFAQTALGSKHFGNTGGSGYTYTGGLGQQSAAVSGAESSIAQLASSLGMSQSDAVKAFQNMLGAGKNSLFSY